MAQLTATGSNTATYTNAFPNADLVYVLENGLLKEYIILKNAAASNSYSFLFQMDGVTLDTTGRNPAFVDVEGAVVFALTDLFAIDANGKPTDAVAFSFQPTGNRGEIIITVTLDEAYLAAPERAFPVIIDPSTMISSSQTADTCVCSGFPATNYYTSSYLRTGMDSDFGIRRSYIKFNLPSLPAQAEITSSVLDVEMLSGVVPNLYASRCTGSWTSSTLTWNNKPGYTATGGSNKAVSQGNGWYSMYVTTIVKSWFAGTYSNYGFVLTDTIENDTNHWTTFYSSDAVSPHKPELHINYSMPGSADISTNALYYIMNGGKYLRATATSTFSMASSASTTNSKELWYFEKVSAGIYRIESLGVRHESSKGKHRNMLTAISSGDGGTLTLNAFVESSAAQQWELQGSASSGYYIVSHAYPQLVLSLNGSTPTLSSNENASKWTLNSKTYSDYKGGGIANATKPYTVNIIVESSAITGFWHAGIFNCYTVWSDVNSNFQFKLSVNGNGQLYEDPDYTVWVEGSNMVNAAGYTEQLTGPDDGNWSGATIRLSTNSGVINNSSHTDADREKSISSRIGTRVET